MTEGVTRRQFVLAAGAAAGAAALPAATADTAAASGLGDLYDRSDATDLAALVLRPGFDDQAFLGLLVGPYEAEVDRAATVLADIKAHRKTSL